MQNSAKNIESTKQQWLMFDIFVHTHVAHLNWLYVSARGWLFCYVVDNKDIINI